MNSRNVLFYFATIIALVAVTAFGIKGPKSRAQKLRPTAEPKSKAKKQGPTAEPKSSTGYNEVARARALAGHYILKPKTELYMDKRYQEFLKAQGLPPDVQIRLVTTNYIDVFIDLREEGNLRRWYVTWVVRGDRHNLNFYSGREFMTTHSDGSYVRSNITVDLETYTAKREFLIKGPKRTEGAKTYWELTKSTEEVKFHVNATTGAVQGFAVRMECKGVVAELEFIKDWRFADSATTTQSPSTPFPTFKWFKRT